MDGTCLTLPPMLRECLITKDSKKTNAGVKEPVVCNADFRAWHRFSIIELSAAFVIFRRSLQD